jgi:hypothetical protein
LVGAILKFRFNSLSFHRINFGWLMLLCAAIARYAGSCGTIAFYLDTRKGQPTSGTFTLFRDFWS